MVIADIGLRGQSGCEFVRALTSDRSKRPIVIVISNESQRPPPEPGIDAHMVKPIDPERLLVLMERLREFYAGLETKQVRDAALHPAPGSS